MPLQRPHIELFYGAPVGHQSEHLVIQRVYDLAIAAGVDAIILANFSAGGRQIDVTVATARGAGVLEAKAVGVPVVGGLNGRWIHRSPAGDRRMTNGYLQAVDAKNALRDAAAKAGFALPYPDAAVVFAPARPAGSSLPEGDFKASVLDLTQLQLPRSKPDAWALDRWRELAVVLGLETAPTVAALLDPALLAAEQALADYGGEFCRTYAGRTEALIPFDCFDVCGRTLASDELGPDDLGVGVLLKGPTGCGKSLVGLDVALRHAAAGGVPLVLDAKQFEGHLGELLDAEARLLGVQSATALLAAARRAGRPVLLNVDGYDECAVAHRTLFTRAIAAFVRRTNAQLVVSSQGRLDGDLLALTEVRVPAPTLALKTAIAQSAARAPLGEAVAPLLAAVGNGLEARMLGEVGSDLPAGASRYALFDLFVRRRLGADGPDGIATLSAIARRLTERLTFHLSLRDYDRMQAEGGGGAGRLDALVEAGLLRIGGDRLTFGHELFFQAFQAEAAVREAGGDAVRLAALFNDGRTAEAKALMLGAVDDDDALTSFLDSITDPQALRACLSGACGALPKLWVEARCERLFAEASAEAIDLAFEPDADGWMGLEKSPRSPRSWTAQERALSEVLPNWLGTPDRLPRLLDAVADIETNRRHETTRLRDAGIDHKVANRNASFGTLYVHGGLALSPALGVNGGALPWRGPPGAFAELLQRRSADWMSAGEAHILLLTARAAGDGYEALGLFMPGMLADIWPRAPYHLRLDLLSAAGICGRDDRELRKTLVEAVRNLEHVDGWGLSSSWFDAMEQLGGFEDEIEGALADLRVNMPAILAHPDDPERQGEAWALYHYRFEHPFSGAYCDAFEELSSEAKAQVLSMAARATDLAGFWVGCLLRDLAACGDPVAAEPIKRWIALPAKDSFMPQEAFGNYLQAHAALGRLNMDLPPEPAAETPAGQAIQACAAIVHLVNRSDLSSEARRRALDAAWSVLAEHPGPGLVALQEFRWSDFETALFPPGPGTPFERVVDGFEPVVLALARLALSRPDDLEAWFHPRHFAPERTLDFAFQILSRWGDETDLSRLRQAAKVAALTMSARRHIQVLEERLLAVA